MADSSDWRRDERFFVGLGLSVWPGVLAYNFPVLGAVAAVLLLIPGAGWLWLRERRLLLFLCAASTSLLGTVLGTRDEREEARRRDSSTPQAAALRQDVAGAVAPPPPPPPPPPVRPAAARVVEARAVLADRHQSPVARYCAALRLFEAEPAVDLQQREHRDVRRNLAAAERAALRIQRAEAREYAGLVCRDGSMSPTCRCAGSHRGCCSWHGGVAGCEPGPDTVSCPLAP